MPRDPHLYLDDIPEAVGQVRRYAAGLNYEGFAADRKTQDAVVRNLEIIGEAARRLPEPTKAAATDIEWRKIIGLRNLLSHEYFGVSLPLIWDVVENKLGPLETACRRLLAGDEPDGNTQE